MNKLKWNIAANYLGRGWTTVLGFLIIPFYIKLLGIESYGLIGFFYVIQNISGLLDFGLGLTLNRELAKTSNQPGTARNQSDLLRTFEIIFWGLGILISMSIIFLAPFISRYWLNPQQLGEIPLEIVIKIIGIIIGVQFPFSLYQSGLMGLQKQVLVNGMTTIVGTVRSIGAVLVLWTISPTIEAFFAWQLFIGILSTLIFMALLWQSLPRAETPPKFKLEVINELWTYSATVSGNSILGAALTQMDKVILSKMLSLENFGYYSLAFSYSSVLWVVIAPINQALFPRFVQLITRNEESGLVKLYHLSSQAMSLMLLPLSLTLIIYSKEILFLWTHNQTIADHVYVIGSLLLIGTTLNGLANIPVCFQFAAGWPKLTMYTNLVSAGFMLPIMILMVSQFGAIGAGISWIILNSIYLTVTVPIMHQKFLKGEKWRWYIADIGVPLVAILTLFGLVRIFLSQEEGTSKALVNLTIFSVLSFGITALALTQIRIWMFDNILRFMRGHE